jgi:cytohesin
MVDFHNEDYLEKAEYLVSKGADLDIKDDEGMAPLHRAARNHFIGFTNFLIDKGADVNAKDREDNTPLDLVRYNASKSGSGPLSDKSEREAIRSITFTLILHGARAEKRVPSSIIEAAIFGDTAKVKEFIRSGADVNSQDDSDMAALHYAVARGQKDVVQLLIANGADVNARGGSYGTPLKIAACEGQTELTELLLASGADINDSVIETALHTASRMGHKVCVDLLISNGADVNAKNYRGETALDLAKTEEIKELLRKHGGVPGEQLKQKEEKRQESSK